MQKNTPEELYNHFAENRSSQNRSVSGEGSDKERRLPSAEVKNLSDARLNQLYRNKLSRDVY